MDNRILFFPITLNVNRGGTALTTHTFNPKLRNGCLLNPPVLFRSFGTRTRATKTNHHANMQLNNGILIFKDLNTRAEI